MSVFFHLTLILIANCDTGHRHSITNKGALVVKPRDEDNGKALDEQKNKHTNIQSNINRYYSFGLYVNNSYLSSILSSPQINTTNKKHIISVCMCVHAYALLIARSCYRHLNNNCWHQCN